MAQHEFEDLLIEAAEAIDNDNPERTLEIVQTLLPRMPRDPDVLSLHADALLELDRAEEAEEVLEDAIEMHPDDPALLLSSADLILHMHFDDTDAVVLAVERAARGEKAALKIDDEMLSGHLAWVQARGLSMIEELKAAASALERARKLLGDHPALLSDLGIALLESLRIDEARTILVQAREAAPEEPDNHHYLGVIAELEGDQAAAEKSFAEARRLSPEEYPEPLSLSAAEFDKVVEDALERLPEPVAKKVREVPILVSDLPRLTELEGDPPLSPMSLGMFRGSAVGDKSVFDPWSQLPSEILLFKKNIERYASDKEEIIEEIEQTLLHEIGHFVGWDEEDLKKRGLD